MREIRMKKKRQPLRKPKQLPCKKIRITTETGATIEIGTETGTTIETETGIIIKMVIGHNAEWKTIKITITG
jgi:hypothetical protein